MGNLSIQIPDRSVTVEEPDNETRNDLTGAQNALALAQAFEIDCQEMYVAAGTELTIVKARYKALDTKRKELTKPLDRLRKQWIEFFQPSIDALQAAEQYYKKIMTAYHTEQEAKRRRAEAEAREQARKEREALESEAAKTEQAGQEEQAEALRVEAEMIHTPIVNVQAPKAAGVSYRSNWSAEVVDKMELIKAVAAGHVSPAVLSVDMKVLNQQARALKNELNYPGVRVIENKTLAAKS